MIAQNNMALAKMKPICQLEERHGVDDLGHAQDCCYASIICICDRIWENPPYGITAQFAQCAFLVPMVRNSKYRFCHIHVKEPFF